MKDRFAATLRRLRQDAGFKTGYAFYHDNGGRRVFPFTYSYYAKIEKSEALPRPAWLPILLSALRLTSGSPGRREFMVAYLAQVFGDDRLFDDLVAPWLAPSEPSAIEKRIVPRLLGALSRQLNVDQFRAVLSSPAALWSFMCLAASHEPLTAEALTKATRLDAAQVGEALRLLSASKLVKRASGGKFSNAFSNRFYWPRQGQSLDQLMGKLREYVDQATARGGRELLSRFVLVRAEEADMLTIAHMLESAVTSGSGAFVNTPGHRTGLYALEARLREVFRF